MQIQRETKIKTRQEKNFLLFLFVIGMVSFGQGLGLGAGFVSNFFSDAYGIDAFARGILEFPREIPGILCVFLMIWMSRKSDVFIAMIAQILCGMTVVILGFWTPGFSVLIAILVVNSLGMHLFFPLQESITVQLSDGKIGRQMGRVKAVALFCTMAASMVVYLGFKSGVFSFKTEVKGVFLISGVAYLIALGLLIWLARRVDLKGKKRERQKLFVKKKYTLFYIAATLSGAHKQMMVVFAPWVLITILGKDAAYMAVLIFISSFIGVYFTSFMGKLVDRLGVRKILHLDAIARISVYLGFGFVALALLKGQMWLGWVAAVLFVLDEMCMQLGMVRVVYLNGILDSPEDLTPTLSMGISFDHTLALACAFVGGWIWINWGVHWVFFIAAAMSVGNLIVARRVD